MASANRVSRSLDLEVKVIDSETRELGSALLWMPGLSSFLPFVCSYLTAHLGRLNVMKRVGVSSNQIKEGLWKEVWKPGREWESALAALISQVPRLSKAKVLLLLLVWGQPWSYCHGWQGFGCLLAPDTLLKSQFESTSISQKSNMTNTWDAIVQ